MKEKTKAYIAGIMDGDGCFSIFKTRQSYKPYIGFTSVYRPLIEWAIDKFGGGLQIQKSFLSKNGYTSQEMYHWRLYGANSSLSFLDLVLPYLREKTEQASLLRDYFNLEGAVNPEAREELFQKMKKTRQPSCLTTDTPNIFGNNTDYAYLSGIVDAEGHITIGRTRRRNTIGYNPRIGITNSYLPVLKMAKELFGGSICSAGNEKGKPLFIWYISSKDAIEKCLLHILPYLIIKRDQAKVLLEFVRLERFAPKEHRMSLYERMVELHTPKTKIQSDLTGDCESAPAGTLAA